MTFADRADAGRRLSELVQPVAGSHPVILGLPRGGVPVAVEVARRLGAPLDVIVVRKLGVPEQPELAMGAVGEGGILVVNHEVIRQSGVLPDQLAAIVERARDEVERYARRFRPDDHPLSIVGRNVVVVDDGIATGATARAACQVARARGAERVVLAIPVAVPRSLAELQSDADAVVCVESPHRLWAVGQWYRDFTQVGDDEVAGLLRQARGRLGRPAPDDEFGGWGTS